MAKYGMVIDLKSCVGCFACVIACKAENATPAGVFWSQVTVQEEGQYPSARISYLPRACMHCEEAPCVAVCPSGATYKRSDGIVALDQNKCIGCRYCQTACPYDARVFIDKMEGYYPDFGLTDYEQQGYKQHTTGTAEKCTFCTQRLEKELEPACVKTCPAQARHFGDLDDPASEVNKLLAKRGGKRLMEELGTKPKVYYLTD